MRGRPRNKDRAAHCHKFNQRQRLLATVWYFATVKGLFKSLWEDNQPWRGRLTARKAGTTSQILKRAPRPVFLDSIDFCVTFLGCKSQSSYDLATSARTLSCRNAPPVPHSPWPLNLRKIAFFNGVLADYSD